MALVSRGATQEYRSPHGEARFDSCFLGRPQKATILSIQEHAMRKILLVLGFQLRFVRGDERANVVRHIQ